MQEEAQRINCREALCAFDTAVGVSFPISLYMYAFLLCVFGFFFVFFFILSNFSLFLGFYTILIPEVIDTSASFTVIKFGYFVCWRFVL